MIVLKKIIKKQINFFFILTLIILILISIFKKSNYLIITVYPEQTAFLLKSKSVKTEIDKDYLRGVRNKFIYSKFKKFNLNNKVSDKISKLYESFQIIQKKNYYILILYEKKFSLEKKQEIEKILRNYYKKISINQNILALNEAYKIYLNRHNSEKLYYMDKENVFYYNQQKKILSLIRQDELSFIKVKYDSQHL